MWTAQHTAETDQPVDAVWAALEALHTGAVPAPDGDTFELHGPFAVGTELDVTPQGQETFRSTIVELVQNERYADRTQFGELVLTSRHVLERSGAGTRVTHELVIDGESADHVGPELGPHITADFPTAMEGLFRLAGATVVR